MSAQHSSAGLEALRNRAKHGLLIGALLDRPSSFAHFRGELKALSALERGLGDKAAAKDSAAGGYLPLADLQTAWATLPVDIERLTLVDVQQLLRAKGVQIAGNPASDSKLDAVEQLEDSVGAAVDLHDEHPAPRVDLNDGASQHGAPLEKSIVAQGDAT